MKEKLEKLKKEIHLSNIIDAAIVLGDVDFLRHHILPSYGYNMIRPPQDPELISAILYEYNVDSIMLAAMSDSDEMVDLVAEGFTAEELKLMLLQKCIYRLNALEIAVFMQNSNAEKAIRLIYKKLEISDEDVSPNISADKKPDTEKDLLNDSKTFLQLRQSRQVTLSSNNLHTSMRLDVNDRDMAKSAFGRECNKPKQT